MSDFSGLEQSFALPAMPPLGDALPIARPVVPQPRTRSYDVRLQDVEFRQLRAADELAAIQKMRAEIQLPGAAVADPGFRAREKKEIGTEWSVRSNGATTSSAR